MGDFSRRDVLRRLSGALAGTVLGARRLAAIGRWPPAMDDVGLLDALTLGAFTYAWEQCGATRLIKDRARAHGEDRRRVASMAATGFGLTTLCIGASRGLRPRDEVVRRVRQTLTNLLDDVPHMRGFFYHFLDADTAVRSAGCEVSSIDTAILLCGVLTCRAYCQDPDITRLASALYDRVDWTWMLDGAATLSHGWTPEHGFLPSRWDSYSEAMMLYLLALGSRTHPIPEASWGAWARPLIEYDGLRFIWGGAPLFVHQFSHAWIDFRGRRDAYADYFENSITATRAHRRFCVSLAPSFPDYSENLWGLSTSDSVHDQAEWGGPPMSGPIDGTIVPCAAGGAVPFLPAESVAVLQQIRQTFDGAWSRYGFVNAFNPLTGWYDPDVVGNALGITALMAENARTGFVWTTFMRNAEVATAMARAGFRTHSAHAGSRTSPVTR